jgi:putative Mn2+ efflux pump MntP
MNELTAVTASLLAGLIVGIDNFRAGMALGAQRLSPVSKKQMSISFIAFEAITPIVGLVIGNSALVLVGFWSEYLGPCVLASLGIYVVCDALTGPKMEKRVNLDNYWIILGLPVSLSFDNLSAGMGLGLIGFPILLSAVIIGGVSASMSGTGLRFGSIIRKRLPHRTELFSGVFLIIIAVVSFLNIQ